MTALSVRLNDKDLEITASTQTHYRTSRFSHFGQEKNLGPHQFQPAFNWRTGVALGYTFQASYILCLFLGCTAGGSQRYEVGILLVSQQPDQRDRTQHPLVHFRWSGSTSPTVLVQLR